MTHRWTALTIPLALLWYGLALAQVAPHLEARWAGDALVVTASEGTVYLVGDLYGEQYVGAGLVRLPAAGVDARYAPEHYERLELRDSSGLVVVSLPIPERRWEVRLVLVVN
jgi:hypothetical protein